MTGGGGSPRQGGGVPRPPTEPVHGAARAEARELERAIPELLSHLQGAGRTRGVRTGGWEEGVTTARMGEHKSSNHGKSRLYVVVI